METRCEDSGRRQGRPFLRRSGARSRGYSLRLQRLAVSMGSDHSLRGASERLLERHGVEVPESAIDRLLSEHGARAVRELPEAPASTLAAEGVPSIVTEADGTMIPVWRYPEQPEPKDGRKRRKIRAYKEMRLFVARPEGAASSRCAGGFVDMEQAAALWSHCARDCRWGAGTYVHGVFDGAEWIRRRFEEQFGECGDWLVDFFHLGEMVGEAASAAGLGEGWASRQLDALKGGSDPGDLLAQLRSRREAEETPDEEAPVRAAIRYVENRLGHLGYAEALAKGLPIGSGMVEGAHRHVLHPRLKIAGAWGEEKAHAVAQLRILRHNKQWDAFWKRAA